MKVALDPETEKRIRRAVKPGDPWALDELTEEICGNDSKLRREFSEIMADEYSASPISYFGRHDWRAL